MRPKMTNPVSDTAFGEFLLGIMKLSVEAKKLAKEIDNMLQIKCSNCGELLSDDEIQEARQNGLRMDDVSCDKCWQAWVSQKIDEERHPDDKSGTIIN